MSVYKRYFRVTSGPLLNRISTLMDEREKAAVSYDVLCKEVGASSAKTYESGAFAGFTFNQRPDRDIYREVKGLWLPKKNCQEGKATLARIAIMPKPLSVQRALDEVGLHTEFPVLLSGNTGYRSTLCGFGKHAIWFVCVPWRDEEPAKLAAYKEEKAAGKHYSMELDHLLWTPPAEWLEIKHWQFLKEWEELSDSKSAA